MDSRLRGNDSAGGMTWGSFQFLFCSPRNGWWQPIWASPRLTPDWQPMLTNALATVVAYQLNESSSIGTTPRSCFPSQMII